ncbi:hypothetical protein [Arthrobacter sp.]|uniref:hypothetical protein n=1 Tax=Arthrobacter sp. TaxID=1667 RepID=UPI003A917CD6
MAGAPPGRGGAEHADRLVIATPGPAAVDLLGTVLPDAAALRPATGNGIALATLVDRPELDDAPAAPPAGCPRHPGVAARR